MSTVCPKCNGTGFELTTGDDGVVTSARCLCDRAGLSERLLRGEVTSNCRLKIDAGNKELLFSVEPASETTV